MKKIKVLFKGPFLVQAGYGVHSRKMLGALLNDPIFEVFLEQINWGNCSFLTEETKEKKNILELLKKTAIYRQQNGLDDWDLFLHCTIPNEFERKGKFNVGITARH